MERELVEPTKLDIEIIWKMSAALVISSIIFFLVGNVVGFAFRSGIFELEKIGKGVNGEETTQSETIEHEDYYKGVFHTCVWIEVDKLKGVVSNAEQQNEILQKCNTFTSGALQQNWYETFGKQK